MSGMLISTWFVSDNADEGTHFPQVGGNSADPRAKAVYWRCIIAFYATSLTHNPNNPHVLFTNTSVPCVDGIDLSALLKRWGVEIIQIPITYRIPLGRVNAWGNQFYIFDVILYIANTERWPAAIVLDSDVVWTRSVDAIEMTVARDGVLTYEHDRGAYPEGVAINGLSREALARFAEAHGGPGGRVIYCGGEVFAARLDAIRRIADCTKPLWAAILASDADAPKEEAHLLSAIYAIERMAIDNGAPFIKRMWTTFHHNNVRASDLSLTLWHLPAEKRTGFDDLFRAMVSRGLATASAAELGLEPALLARLFGIPRRSPRKLTRDLLLKLADRFVRFLG